MRNEAFGPGFPINQCYFDVIQEEHVPTLDGTGTQMLVGRMRFRKQKFCNCIEATRAVRPENSLSHLLQQFQRLESNNRSMLTTCTVPCGHDHDVVHFDTARQLRMKATARLGYCDGCARERASARLSPGPHIAVPSSACIACSPTSRDLWLVSTDGADHCLMIVDDATKWRGRSFGRIAARGHGF